MPIDPIKSESGSGRPPLKQSGGPKDISGGLAPTLTESGSGRAPLKQSAGGDAYAGGPTAYPTLPRPSGASSKPALH